MDNHKIYEHITQFLTFLLSQTYITENQHAKYDLDKIIEKMIYTPPEMSPYIILHGNTQKGGLITFLNMYCSDNETIYNEFMKLKSKL